MKAVLSNIFWLLILATISIGYLSTMSHFVPAKAAAITNFMVLPVILGIVSFYVFSGSIFQIIIWACTIAIVHLFWFGGDPAKPGLENVLMYLEMVFIVLGIGVASLVKKVMQ